MSLTEAQKKYQREWYRTKRRKQGLSRRPPGEGMTAAERQRKHRRLFPLSQRDYHLRSKFGITEAEYETMFDRQGGRCKLCGQTEQRALSVDHCHRTGRVRGLLCTRCNAGLGALGDSVARLREAIAYLEEGNAPS